MGVTTRNWVRERRAVMEGVDFQRLELLMNFANARTNSGKKAAVEPLLSAFSSSYLHIANGDDVIFSDVTEARTLATSALEHLVEIVPAMESASGGRRRAAEQVLSTLEDQINAVLEATVVMTAPRLEKGRLQQYQTVVGALPKEAVALVIALLLDRPRDYARRLGRCKFEDCGRFFFYHVPKFSGTPAFCEDHIRSKARTAMRVAKFRRGS